MQLPLHLCMECRTKSITLRSKSTSYNSDRFSEKRKLLVRSQCILRSCWSYLIIDPIEFVCVDPAGCIGDTCKQSSQRGYPRSIRSWLGYGSGWLIVKMQWYAISFLVRSVCTGFKWHMRIAMDCGPFCAPYIDAESESNWSCGPRYTDRQPPSLCN